MGSSSSHEFTTEITPRLQPCQIVCLEHETSYLYAEVIQIIESRQLCWARPLMLIRQSSETRFCNSMTCEQSDYYDLRQDSDLLLPLTLFRLALDTEVCSWIACLYADDHNLTAPSDSPGRGHQPFRQFIQQVWKAHPNAFQKLAVLDEP